MTQPDGDTTDGDVTALLKAWNHGDESALAELMDVVRGELHHMARGLFKHERPNHTLQPTAVVHEVYLKLENQRRVSFHHRREFFAVTARLMRRILVDHARKNGAVKRGGRILQISLDDSADLPGDLAPEILALDDALIDLERRSPRQSRIVEMRTLVGLSLEEVAGVEKISLSTVTREWRTARLFLLSQLQDP